MGGMDGQTMRRQTTNPAFSSPRDVSLASGKCAPLAQRYLRLRICHPARNVGADELNCVPRRIARGEQAYGRCNSATRNQVDIGKAHILPLGAFGDDGGDRF
jgi:hypothetical protein